MAKAIEDWTRDLADLLSANKASSIRPMKKPEDAAEESFAIFNPWNDASLVLDLGKGGEKLAGSLNNIVLTERFSAIWHKDTKNFEAIFQAFPVANPIKDIKSRSFTFRLRDKTHECGCGPSSRSLEA